MGKVGTFVDANESQDDILKRHKEFHLERMLEANDRLCYPYGIWKSAKRKMRWISGVKRNEKVKGMEQEEDGCGRRWGRKTTRVVGRCRKGVSRGD